MQGSRASARARRLFALFPVEPVPALVLLLVGVRVDELVLHEQVVRRLVVELHVVEWVGEDFRRPDQAGLQILDKEKLPWACIHDMPGDKSLSSQYGVMFIPLPILVDREGRVVSMSARGPELERLLEKYIGDKDNKGN